MLSSQNLSVIDRENVNTLSISSGKDNFYVFPLFSAEVISQIIIKNCQIFCERFNIFRIHIFIFLDPCCVAHRFEKRRLFFKFLENRDCERENSFNFVNSLCRCQILNLLSFYI